MAWNRDIVGEQAQTAPLFDTLSSSPNGKRSLPLETDETQLRKKKRESLLNVAFSRTQSSNVASRLTDPKMLGISQGSSERQPYTVCCLCDLHFINELELEEHLYSLLHHRAIETEKGKDFVHECNLCCARCKGLAEYVGHLRDDQHKYNVEKRKEDIENNKTPGPLYSLIRYKETFIHPPRKPTKTAPPPKKITEDKKLSTQRSASASDLRRSLNVEKGQLYQNRRMAGSSQSDLRENHGHTNSLNHKPRIRSLLGSPPKWQRNPDMSFRFHYPPNGPRHPIQLGHPHYGPSGRWMGGSYYGDRKYYDDGYGHNHNDFYSPGHQELLADGGDTNVFRDRLNEHRYPLSSSRERLFPSKQPRDVSQSSSKSSPSLARNSKVMKKWKKKLKQQKKNFDNKPSGHSISPSSGTDSSPRHTLLVGDLSRSDIASQSSNISNNSPRLKLTSSSAKKRNQNKSIKRPMSKPRQNDETNHKIPKNKKSSGNASLVSTLRTKSVESLYRQGRTSSGTTSSSVLVPREGSGTSRSTTSGTDSTTNCDTTKQLREKFRKVIDSLEQPSSHPNSSTSSRTKLHPNSSSEKPGVIRNASAPGTSKVGGSSGQVDPSATNVHQKQEFECPRCEKTFARKDIYIRHAKKSCRSENASPEAKKLKISEVFSLSCPSSIESPSVIRNKLLELAKTKEQQQNDLRSSSTVDEQTSFSSKSEQSHDKISSDRSEELSDCKKKDLPRPNLSKARCRLTSKPAQLPVGSTDPDTDKHARLANLMLKSRHKPHTTSPKKASNTDQLGPRFGIGVSPRENDQLKLDESDFLDILHSINEVEATGETPLSTNSPTNPQSKEKHGSATSAKPPSAIPSKPPAFPAPSNPIHAPNNPSPNHMKTSSQPLLSYPSKPPLSVPAPSSLFPKPIAPLSNKTPTPIVPIPRGTPTPIVPISRDTPSPIVPISRGTPTHIVLNSRGTPTPSVPISRGAPTRVDAPSKNPSDDLSLKLLHMSEREELLHEQDQVMKEKSVKLSEEMAHVNLLIEQLVERKKDLDEARKKVDGEAEVIRSDLEAIRQNRLAMLRTSTGSAGSNVQEGSTPSSGRSGRPDSCTHSTPTPQSNFNLTPRTPLAKDPNFPDSQSTISNTSLQTPNQSRYESALGNQSSLSVKDERPPAPSQPSNPFPVASGSMYFDAKAPTSETKAMSPSVDKILGKYLKEAGNERGVVSSTTPLKSMANNQSIPNHLGSPDTEVTSTTCHRDVRNRGESPGKNPVKKSTSRPLKNVSGKKKVLPSDPHLAKLALEQPSSKDVTTSWVTAIDRSCDPSNSILTNQTLVPTNLTAEQNEVASLHAMTLEHHSASVLSVHVTECGKILSCSKDKTLCVSDGENGQLLERYDLPGIPFRTCITYERGSGVLTLYVVFVDDANEKGMLADSSLHRVRINLQSTDPDVESSQPRMKKLLDHNNCIMCVHQHQNLLYLGARDGKVAIFCTSTNKVKDVLDCHSPHAVCCVATGTDGGRGVMCCGSSDCKISVRDANDGLLLNTLLGHNKTVNCLQLDRNLLYSGSSDRNVLVHNIQSGDVIYRFLGMHGGSIKSLFLDRSAVVTLCLDKSIRVLRSEPCRSTGSPKPLSSLPLSMHVHFQKLAGSWGGSNIVLAYAYVGCQDGKVQVVPLNQLAYKVPVQKKNPPSEMCVKEEIVSPLDYPMDVGNNLQCMWNGCEAVGFTNSSSLLTHITLFHATDSYKEKLDSCCLWGNCTHYFSSDLDTALDVHMHMDRHVTDAVQFSRHS